jgi:MFS superfamily sulfate permease-like transporter
MVISFLVGIAVGTCLGLLVMSMLTFRQGRVAQISGEKAEDVTYGVTRRDAPPRRHNKHPRNRDTREEVQSDPNIEQSLV